MVNGLVAQVEVAWTEISTLMGKAAFKHTGKFGVGVGVLEHARSWCRFEQESPRPPAGRYNDWPHADARRDPADGTYVVVIENFRQSCIMAKSTADRRSSALVMPLYTRHDGIEGVRGQIDPFSHFKRYPSNPFECADQALAVGTHSDVRSDHKLRRLIQRAACKAAEKLIGRVM